MNYITQLFHSFINDLEFHSLKFLKQENSLSIQQTKNYPSFVCLQKKTLFPLNYQSLTLYWIQGGTTSFTMKNLSPFTQYQAFILPFAKAAFGRPSVLISFTTKETG